MTTEEIEVWLQENNIPLLAKIPFDTQMVESMIKEKTIIEYDPQTKASIALKIIWSKLNQHNISSE